MINLFTLFTMGEIKYPGLMLMIVKVHVVSFQHLILLMEIFFALSLKISLIKWSNSIPFIYIFLNCNIIFSFQKRNTYPHFLTFSIYHDCYMFKKY